MSNESSNEGDPISAFLEAACVPLDGSWHASGTLALAEEIRTAHPEVTASAIHVAAALGDEASVRDWLARDPGAATRTGGPHGWDPLTYLCFSRYLRLDPTRAFVGAAAALLDAGADPNTGFLTDGHGDAPERESVIYGAAGVAHHPELTRLLLERGANPNDDETPYHTPETTDNRALEVLVESGRLAPRSLATMLHRKLDWRDYDAVVWLLDRGADPNLLLPWGHPALHHAIGRASPLRYFEALLTHGADPTVAAADGMSAFAQAARRGRADALALFAARGFSVPLARDEAFLAACACGDAAAARAAVDADPGLVARLEATENGSTLAEFAGGGNAVGVRLLLDLGFSIASRTSDGGARGDTALHVAVWRGHEDVVRLLLARGADIEATNGRGNRPLDLAVRAVVEQSDWTPHPSAAIATLLLEAGARIENVRRWPEGSPVLDDLRARHETNG